MSWNVQPRGAVKRGIGRADRDSRNHDGQVCIDIHGVQDSITLAYGSPSPGPSWNGTACGTRPTAAPHRLRPHRRPGLLPDCYDRRMAEVASRELRNDTAGVLRRVQTGEEIVITVNGKPVAQLVPLQRARRRWLPRTELTRRLRVAQADPGLRADLARLAGETTDQLGPIR